MEKNLNIKDFDYNLEDDRIAKFPLDERDKSKLLVYKDGIINDSVFKNIHNFLPNNSLLVMNNTKVIHARIIFRKPTGSKIEIFCLNPHSPAEYTSVFSAKNKCSWQCIVGNAKKWKTDSLSMTFDVENTECTLIAKKIAKTDNYQIIEFSWDKDFTFGEILNAVGKIPIPPYLNRQSEKSDEVRYQTVYSKYEGSVAAPTAGLHFTENVFNNLKKQNIKTAEVTLHVGAGTFKPVKSENIRDHEMHTEFFTVSAETIKQLIQNTGKIISVGTTTLRTLESIYWIGVKLHFKMPDFDFIDQWEIYDLQEIDVTTALNEVLNYLDKNELTQLKAYTQIIIVPGYKFKIVNQLITNFHQPKSTLLLLVAAFVGDDWKKIYDFALKNDYRFLSYGDSSLLFGKN